MSAPASEQAVGFAKFKRIVLILGVAGCSDSVGPRSNERPVAFITAPAPGATFHAGDVVTFAGGATDREDGTLGADRLSWWAELHHDEHTHPFMNVTTGIDGGTVTLPTRGETSDNIWYRFHLAATDAAGTADTVYRDIQPQKATLRFRTLPPGLQLTLDGQPRAAPFDVVGVTGAERDLGVVSPQTMNGQAYAFVSWSQGGSAFQTVVVPVDATTYTATFDPVETTNQPPTVSLTAPTAGAQLPVQTAVSVSATAADADGTVVVVDFYANGAQIGTDNTSPYSTQWVPAAAGEFALSARATDNHGAQTTSATVNVTVTPTGAGDVTPPVAQLTAPTDGAQNLTGAVTLTATASDNVGVVGVRFQVDGVDLGEDTSVPYSATLPATSAYAHGVHVMRARARDAAGNVSPWSAATVSFGGTQALEAGFSMAQFGASLPDLPTSLTFAPDGRLFIALKQGSVRIVENGTLLAQSFAAFTVASAGELGLLGIALHPNFATNGYVYVHYSIPTASSFQGRVSRVTANGNSMVPGSEIEIATFPVEASPFHNGGALHFGPDGRLYVAIGDDATPANAQSMTTVFGKILRFNDDGSIPADNPFFGSTSGMNRAIWALGLRNPFTFAFQPGTGRMLINDVGQDTWEEINEGAAGRNFGWPATEGPHDNPSYSSPVYAYPHFGALVTGFSIVGGAFYNPGVQLFPASYTGSYFFADYVSRWVYRLDTANGDAAYAFAWMPSPVTDLRVGPDGALYVLLAPSVGSGLVQRITFTP